MSKSDDERGFLAERSVLPLDRRKPENEKPHYLGHRERLRERFGAAGHSALPDYELLELLLFRLIPRADTKPVARRCSPGSANWPRFWGRPKRCSKRSRVSGRRRRLISR